MRKSGNGTPAPQWVYVAIHFIFYIIPNPFVVKIGIGGSWLNRLGGVSRSLPGFVLPVFLVWVPFAWHIEQKIHRELKPLHVPYFGSGKTEWLFVLAVIFAVPLLAAYFVAIWGLIIYILFTAAGEQVIAINCLSWVCDHPKGFFSIVGAVKLTVILTQIIQKFIKI